MAKLQSINVLPQSPFWRLLSFSASQAEYMSRSVNIWATATAMKISVFPLVKEVNRETCTEQWNVYNALLCLLQLQAVIDSDLHVPCSD